MPNTVAELEALLTANASQGNRVIDAYEARLMGLGKKVFPGAQIGTAADDQANQRRAQASLSEVERIQRASYARQIANAQLAQTRVAGIQAQSEARRAAIALEGNAREEAAQSAHLRRMIQQREMYEARRSTLAGQAAYGQRLSTVGSQFTRTFTLPTVVVGALAGREIIQFEKTWADAKKNIDGTATAVNRVKMSVRDMAAGKSAIPIDVKELAKIASAAGQLGIHTPEVAAFTKTIGMLSTSTNLSTSAASTGLARIDTILQTGQKQFDRYGATIVALGKDGASTEVEIVNITQRLAGQAKQIGINAAQTLSYGSAIASVGVRQEAGGTAMSTFWKKVDSGVRAGGDALNGFAKVAGMSSAQFKKAWETDASKATVAFVEGLGKLKSQGGSAAGTLDDLGLKGSRVQDVLLRLAGAGTRLREQLAVGETGWSKNTALMDAFETKTKTTASQLQILKNRLTEIALKGGDAVLPDVNKNLQGFSNGIPENMEKIANAYEALGPAGQTALKGLLAVTLATGPLLKLAGGAIAARATLAELVPAVVLTRLAALGPLLADPLISIPLIVTALGLGAIAWQNYIASVNDVEVAHHNAAMAQKSFQYELGRAEKFASASPTAKTAIGKLQEDAAAAGNDTGKLITLIQKANAEKVEIGKDMKLSPLGKAAAEYELNRFIHSLSSRVIEIDVRMTGAVDIANNRNTPEAHEETWQTRARRAGVELPAQPKKTAMHSADFLDGIISIPYEGDNWNFDAENKKWTEARQAIIDWEKAHLHANATAAAASHNATQAVTEQTKAVGKLTDKELANETTRLTAMRDKGQLTSGKPGFDINALLRAGDVDQENQKRADKRKTAEDKATADRILAEGKIKAAAEKAQKEAEEQAEETARRLAQIQSEKLSKQLQALNSFASQVEQITTAINQVGAEGDFKEKWATQARLAGREFDTIPPKLKAIAIGIASIKDEMTGLTGTRDRQRGLLGELGASAISKGLPLDELRQSAAFFEKRLDYEKRMTAEQRRAGLATQKAIGTVEGARGALTTAQEQNDESLRKSSGVYSGGGSPASVVSASGQVPAYLKTFYDNIGATTSTITGAAFDCGKSISWALNKAGLGVRASAVTAMNNVHADGQGHYPVGTILHLGQGGRGTTRHYGMAGAIRSDGKQEFVESTANVGNMTAAGYHIRNSRTVEQIANRIIGAGLPAGVATATATITQAANTSSRAAAGHVPALGGAYDPRAYNPATPPDYSGKLLETMLPKGWGKAVTEFGLAPGETRQWRTKIQAAMLDTKTATKDAKALGMTLDEYAAAWRRIADRADAGDAAATAHDLAMQKLRELHRGTIGAQSGRTDEISGYLLDASQGAYSKTPAKDRLSVLHGMVSQTMAESAKRTRDFNSEQFNQAKILAAGAPFLKGAATDMVAYERATADAQRRVENWKSLQPVRDSIASLWDSARQSAAAGDVRGLSQKSTDAKVLQHQHDVELKALNEGGKNTAGSQEDRAATIEVGNRLTAQREVNSLLQFQTTLLRQNALSQQQVADAVEVETVRRETLKRLTSTKPGQTPEQIEENKRLATIGADEAAAAKRGEIRSRNRIASTWSQRDLLRGSRDAWTGLRNDRSLAESYGVDSPEAEIKRQVAAKRREMRGRQGTDKLPEYQITEQVKDFEKQLRYGAKTNQIQDDKRKILESQNKILSIGEQFEMRLARTASERFEIELRYEQKRRDAAEKRGTIESSIAKAARLESEAVQRADAARQDRLDRQDAQAHDVQSVLRGLMDGKNPFDMLKGQILDQGAASLTNSIFGKKTVDDRAGGLLDLFQHGLHKRKKGDADTPIGTDPETGFTAPFFKNLLAPSPIRVDTRSLTEQFPHLATAFLPRPIVARGSGAFGGAGEGGAISVERLTVITPQTRVESQYTQVNGGLAARGGTAGAGSSSSGEQILGAVLRGSGKIFGRGHGGKAAGGSEGSAGATTA